MPEDQRYKAMRHIETVRNYLNTVHRELLNRAEQHDQSKLKEPERSFFDEYSPRLRKMSYGSKEYKELTKKMKVGIKHHYSKNRHHPEFHRNGIRDMNLMDLIEMVCDWKAATLRHNNGNIKKSIKINQKRFNYSDELAQIFLNTAKFLNDNEPFNRGEES